MSDIKQLARDFHELEEQLVTCIRCGMCQSVCPVFEQTRKEADVARGKLALLNGLMARMFEDPQGVSSRLNKCLLCGSCAANCPSGVNALEIFIRARTLLAGYLGLSAAKKIIFKQMLARPAFFNSLMSFAQKIQPLIVKKRHQSPGTSCARFNMPLVGHRNFIPLSDTPFHKSKESKHFSLKKTNRSSQPTVAFFTGCLIDKMLPQIAHAAVKVFLHHHIDIIVPPNQGCCGIPALASGDKDTFETLVRYHLDLFDGNDFDYLITACATCTSTIKKLWPVFSEDKTRALSLADKTLDINQFLVDVIHLDTPFQTTEDKRKVAYHDPCHLKKSLGVCTQPREVIRQSGCELAEMPGADKCCGMGGSFNLFHYDLSSRIGTLKQESIVQSGCDTVATGCPACIMQISDMLSKADITIPVKHPIELYADTI